MMGIYRRKISRQHFNAKLPSGESVPVYKDLFAYKMGNWYEQDNYERKYVAPTVRAWEKAGESPKGKFVTYPYNDPGGELQAVYRYPYDDPTYVEEYPAEEFGIIYKSGRGYRIDPMATPGEYLVSEVPMHVEHWHNKNRTLRAAPQEADNPNSSHTMWFYEDGKLVLEESGYWSEDVKKYGSAFLANA